MHYSCPSGRFLPRLVLSAFLLFAFVPASSLFASDSNLTPLGMSNGNFYFQLTAQDPQDVVVEASTNLVEWSQILEQPQVSGALQVIDFNAVGLNRQFYRVRQVLLSALKPREADVFIGDHLLFLVEAVGLPADWQYTVNGVPGGNASVGLIQVQTNNPSQALFIAPTSGGPQTVTVCATDPAATNRQYCATVRIHPLPSQFIIVPAAPVELRLGGELQFSAGSMVEGIGFVPLQQVFWKVNGDVAGNENLGVIDFNGIYSAPLTMPTNAPVLIDIGYSLSYDGPLVASNRITLVELVVTPPLVRSLNLGHVATLTVQMRKSDVAGLFAVAAGDVHFESGNENVATVDAQGQIFLYKDDGQTAIAVTHNALGATAMMTVEARADCHIRLTEIEPITDDVVRVQKSGSAITLIESTRPGTRLRLSPDLFFYRGALNILTNSLNGGGGTNLTITGDGIRVFDYSRNGPPIQPSGSVAIVERETGIVTFGDSPGSGTVRFTYTDEFITRTATVLLTFTRLTLKVSGRGETTSRTNEPYISEWYSVDVILTNELGSSDFVPDTVIRVRMETNEVFQAAHLNQDDPAGITVLPWPSTFHETAELRMRVPATTPDNSEQISPLITRGQMNFRISPDRAGEQRFIVDVPGDTLIPPQEIVFNVLRPALRIRPGDVEFNAFNADGYGAFSNSLITAHSWVDLEHDQVGPFLDAYPWYPGIGSGFMHFQDPLAWTIRHPDNSIEVLPYYRDPLFGGPFNRFNGQFRQPGTYHISLGFSDRPGIRTEEIAISVIAPGPNFPEVANAEMLVQTNAQGDVVFPSGKFGGMKIVSPSSGAWVRGVPITVQLQCYDGNGFPARIGKQVVQIARSSGSPTVTRTTNYTVVRIFPRRLSGPIPVLDANGLSLFSFNQKIPLADANGQVQFSMTMQDTTLGEESQDFAMAFVPALQTLSPEEYAQLGGSPGLPVEQTETLDGVIVNQVRVPISVAAYAHEPNKSFLQPGLMLPGRGMIASPQFVPIASDRVRQAVADGKLPAGSADVTFKILGGTGFRQSIDSGVSSIDLGPGLTLLNSYNVSNGLELTASTDYAYFGTNSERYVQRPITIAFGNGTTSRVDLNIVGYRMQPISAQKDHNVPLNAAYGYEAYNSPFAGTTARRFPDGVVTYETVPMNFNQPLYGMELQLRPSIHACWDINQDGLEQLNEDSHLDGEYDELDNNGGVPYRGVLPENPLVGFSRLVDPRKGVSVVRRLKARLTPSTQGAFSIWGDITDRRRWNRETGQLGPKRDPDQIPDFASRSANAESVTATFEGNIADFVAFTAYNFVATPTAGLVDPGINFSNVTSSMETAYERYSELPPDDTMESLSASAKVAGSMSVYVDHEADTSFFGVDKDYLYGFVPGQFYAGILDQFYQRTTKGGGHGYYTSSRELGRDGRVRPYDRPQDRLVTGVNRAFFGIDLDGVFYDPNWLNFPRVRAWDSNPLKNLAAGKVIDALPNSEELLDDIIVADSMFGGIAALSTNNLVPRAGGSSGGYVGLDLWKVGAAKVEAKTPGANLPGLHAGYLVLNRPEDLIDPRNNLIEDDFRDVVIKRNGPGQAIQQEDIFLGAREQRFVHGLAQNDDSKLPVQTAARMNYSFLVTTDPAGVTPADTNLWKLRPAILVREKPVRDDYSTDLIVTSQSDGNEKTVKIAADAAVDIVAEVVIGVVFGVMKKSAGVSCESEIGQKLMHLGLDFVINGISDSEYVESVFEPDSLKDTRDAFTFTRKTLHAGHKTPIPGITVPGYAKVFDLNRNFFSSPKLKVGDLPGKVFAKPCEIFATPVRLLAGNIKSKYSAETFGGLGAAEAIGAKVLAIAIPRSAWLTNDAVYSVNFNLIRRIDIKPVEEAAVALEDLPWQGLFNQYPYADEVSDEEFLRVLSEKQNHPALGEAATLILRAIGRKSVIRHPLFTTYSHYKIRAWNVPTLSGMVAPGYRFNASQVFGDFALVPGQTEIPVSSANVAIARRSNENAGARAQVISPGYEMVFVGGVIKDPGPPR